VDFLTKKKVKNNGEAPQYYVEDSHPAIIDKEMWEATQLEMERRQVFAETYGIYKLDYATLDNPFAGRVICGRCGDLYRCTAMGYLFSYSEKIYLTISLIRL